MAGAIEAIPDEAILAEAERDRGDGIAGLPNVVRDAAGQPRVGRFGWKGDIATVDQFVPEAMRNELGLTNRSSSLSRSRNYLYKIDAISAKIQPRADSNEAMRP